MNKVKYSINDWAMKMKVKMILVGIIIQSLPHCKQFPHCNNDDIITPRILALCPQLRHRRHSDNPHISAHTNSQSNTKQECSVRRSVFDSCKRYHVNISFWFNHEKEPLFGSFLLPLQAPPEEAISPSTAQHQAGRPQRENVRQRPLARISWRAATVCMLSGWLP